MPLIGITICDADNLVYGDGEAGFSYTLV